MIRIRVHKNCRQINYARVSKTKRISCKRNYRKHIMNIFCIFYTLQPVHALARSRKGCCNPRDPPGIISQVSTLSYVLSRFVYSPLFMQLLCPPLSAASPFFPVRLPDSRVSCVLRPGRKTLRWIRKINFPRLIYSGAGK